MTEELLAQYGPQLGIFVPTVASLIWFIRYLTNEIAEERKRRAEITDRFLEVQPVLTAALSELTTLIKMWVK